MIGLLPASGNAARMRGLPKFLMPTITGETLLEYHVRLMQECDIPVRVCTNERWLPTVREFLDSSCDVVAIPASTMNRAVIEMASHDNVIGMPDTFFTEGNPYLALTSPVSVGLWDCPPRLRGRVGQVNYDGTILDVQDKNPECLYRHMWGVLRLSGDAVRMLDADHAHPGIDLPTILSVLPYSVAVNSGDYVDCGTPEGLRTMLNYGHGAVPSDGGGGS
jgi:hypothetical protein